jgi:hypothetical protein
MAKKKKADEEPQPEESSGGSIAVNDAWTGILAISLLALMIGSGFLAYDYFVLYYGEKMPDVPRIVGAPPGQPPAGPKIENPQPKDGAAKDAPPKDAPPKDAPPKDGMP